MGLGWDSVRHPQCVHSLVLNFPGSSVLRIRLLRQEMQVQFLGWEDPLEKEMATHSNILAWEILWTEEPGKIQSTGSQRVRYDLSTA